MLKNKMMMMLMAAAVSGLLTFGASSYAAMQDNAVGKMKEDKLPTFSQEFSQISSRLSLTDKQQQSIKPILEQAHQSKKDILQQAGLDVNKVREQGGIPKSQRRELMKNMHNVDKQTNDSMARILDKNQLKQWKSFQDSKRKARQHMWKTEKGSVAGWGN